MSVYSNLSVSRDAYHRDLQFFPAIREFGTAYLVDVNSALRNGTAAVSALKEVPKFCAQFIGVSSALGGGVGVPLGLCIARDGFLKAKAAAQFKDVEGVIHKALWSSVGLSYAGASGILAAYGGLTLANKTIPAAINPAFAGSSFALYGALLAYGTYGYLQTKSFGGNLQKALASNTALEWIKAQLTLSEKEMCKAQKTPHFEEEMKRLLLKKWNRFELRTNASITKLVIQKLLIEKISDPKELNALIYEVQKANYKEKIKHLIFIASAVIGLLAAIFIVVAMGPASPLLFAIGAVVWLTIDHSALHQYVGDKCWRWFIPNLGNNFSFEHVKAAGIRRS